MRSEKLVRAAQEAVKRAYAPYSHLKVGAAVLTGDGRVFTGCNVENAAYSIAICAERTAIVKAVSEGSRVIKEVAVASTSVEPLLPCGMCLQTISEFAKNGKVKITAVGRSGKSETYLLGEIFPSGIRVHKTIRSVTV